MPGLTELPPTARMPEFERPLGITYLHAMNLRISDFAAVAGEDSSLTATS